MSEAASLRIAPIGTTGRPDRPSGDDRGLLAETGSAADRGADLILLPQLSFSPYFPATRNREALELGERFPSGNLAAARQAAGGAWVAASAYECVGEGVFYVTAQLGSQAEGTRLVQRQHSIDARPGRFEQMFLSPGHGGRQVGELPWGQTAMLVGSDLRDPSAWAELSRLGAQLLLGSVSESSDAWPGTCRLAAGLATVHGVAVCTVNRASAPDEPEFGGGSFACDAAGVEVTADSDGIVNLSISTLRNVR